MKKQLLLILLPVFFQIVLYAQEPSGYYNGTAGLDGTTLKAALNSIISNHTEYDYDAIKEIIKLTDEDPANSNNVILLYTGRSQSKSSFGNNADDWNREHVWAKSHGDFGETKPCGTDLHHIRPTDVSVNNSRGNLDFDNGGNPHSEATGCSYDSDSWEPRDEVKGDVARMMLYMVVRYEGFSGEPDLELVDYVGTDGTPTFGKLSTLLSWHHLDTVDDFERHRNDVIYQYQGNRNPFVDRPVFVSYIWEGASAGKEETGINDYALSVYPNPAKDILNVCAPHLFNKKMTVIFYNALGRPVKTIKDLQVSKKNTLPVYDLERGAYFVKFISGDITSVERVVIER
ncbi:MAG: endonuclease [Bacteroidetes bacterium]|nr:endonuclease [Bacteroidota bacterium]